MGPVAFWSAAAIVGLSPWIRGGNRPAALIVLELLSLLMLVAVSWRGAAGRPSVSPILLTLLASPLWIALLQLVPLPAEVWQSLPGHGKYPALLDAFGIPSNRSRPATLLPTATLYAALAGMPLVAAFVGGFFSRVDQLRRIFLIVVAIAIVQVVLGVVQLGSGSDSPLLFGIPADRAIGSFANPNHLASYLCLATGGAACAAHLQALKQQRLAVLPWALVVLTLLVGVLLTRSRGAESLALLPTLAALALVLIRWIPFNARRLVVGGAAVLAIALATVGFDLAASRISGTLFIESAQGRLELASSAWDGALMFFPFGSGLGTFEPVYAQFQPESIGGRVNHAHMDYVELVFECGAFFIVAAACFLVLAARKLRALWCRGGAIKTFGTERMLSWVCVGTLAGFFLHSLVEFNMRIPANAILASLLAGIFLRPSETRSLRTPDDRPA